MGRGDPDHYRILAIPIIEDEDAKRANRERETLAAETKRLVNCMKACLMRFGVRGFDPTLRKAANRVEKLITPEGVRLPPQTLAEMLPDLARLRFLRERIRSIEKARVARLKNDPTTRTNLMVHLIGRIFGIGMLMATQMVAWHAQSPSSVRAAKAGRDPCRLWGLTA